MDMGDRFGPDEQNVTLDTSRTKSVDQFNITVSLRNLHELTAKQADRYLKELIVQALKTAVMQNYGTIQRLVDEFIHSDEARSMIEDTIKQELKKRAEESIKDMFG